MRIRVLGVSLCALILSGCGIFPGQPPLPRQAAQERSAGPSRGADYAALVAGAEIVYFPAERAASGARSEPSAMILEALRKSGARFVIGWDLLEADQQPILDELPGTSGAAREAIIARLKITGTGRAREHFRAVLRDERLTDLPHLALRIPSIVLARLDAGERLTGEEERTLPRGFTPPPGGSEIFSERLAAGRAGEVRSYRGQMVAQQFAAERIVRQVRATGAGDKLLVFLKGEDMEVGRGVPRYVEQKVQARQVIWGPDERERGRPRLLTGL